MSATIRTKSTKTTQYTILIDELELRRMLGVSHTITIPAYADMYMDDETNEIHITWSKTEEIC